MPWQGSTWLRTFLTLHGSALEISPTPSPRLMQIHLVRNSTSVRFEKIPQNHLLRIYSMQLFPSPKNRIM